MTQASETRPEQRATLPEGYTENARNLSDTKETTETRDLVVCIGGEIRTAMTARWYMGRSKSASVVYCSIWVHEPKNWSGWSGHGRAGGWGYCKVSQAFEGACDSAGIKLSRMVGGVGRSAVDEAMRAIVLAAGWDESAPWGIVS